MGIHGFCKFYRALLSNRRYEHSIGYYDKNIVIVDASFVLYKQCIGRQRTLRTENIHIVSIVSFTCDLLSYGLQPIYVFDGKPPKEKIDMINKRKSFKQKLMEKDIPSVHITLRQMMECQHILTLMGIPYVVCLEEADIQCAVLNMYYKDRVIGVITDDTDILLYGGTILKNFSLKTGRTIELNPTNVLDFLLEEANKIRKDHCMDEFDKLSQDDFINFSILLGTDYCYIHRLERITPNQIFEAFILNDLNIEKTIDFLSKTSVIHISDDFMEYFEKIKNIYTKSKIISPDTIDINRKRSNIKGITDFLHEYDIYNEYINMKIHRNLSDFTSEDKFRHFRKFR